MQTGNRAYSGIERKARRRSVKDKVRALRLKGQV
jgi:hypothetical protein